MKRLLCIVFILALLCCGTSALAYHKNDQGVYVDDSGNVIDELWDDAAGLYIVGGVGYPIVDSDGESGGTSDGMSDTGIPLNEDGSITVESGQLPIADSVAESTGHLTPVEWGARWAKYTAANGVTTGTVYMDDAGNVTPAEIKYLGLGRSTIITGGKELIVPTSSLRWDTEAPDDKVLALVTPAKQSYLTLRAKKSQKSFVMGHCDKCKVLRVIGTGKTWTMVDDEGVRGYVLTSGLTFFDNSPRQYAAGMITVKGKTPSGNTVHVRSSNKNGARQIAEFDVGTPITVFAQDDKWCEIDVAGLHCYILSQFVTLQEPLITASTAGEAAGDTAEN